MNDKRIEEKIMELLGVKIGDYCHVHKWEDKDPHDPWSVGFLDAISITEKGIGFQVRGDGVDRRYFPHCEKITSEEGERLVARVEE